MLIGEEQWKAVDSSIVRNGSLWTVVFQKELISHSKYIKRLQAWNLFLKRYLKELIFVQHCFVFFHVSLATSITNRVQIFTDLLFLGETRSQYTGPNFIELLMQKILLNKKILLSNSTQNKSQILYIIFCMLLGSFMLQ